MKKWYEEDIKELILEKKHVILGKEDSSKNVILFEKGIVISSTIADVLVFSKEQGIIGIEIKTVHDTTRRLNKQLRNYSKVCDYVYVMCHDKHIKQTEEVLRNQKHVHVGIIAYVEFKDEVMMGVYKEAKKSPQKSVNMAFHMLWRDEIVNLLGSFKRQVKTLEEMGLKVNIAKSRSDGLHGLYAQSNASSKYLRKGDMIGMIVNRLGEEKANELLCSIFISERMHPDKHLKFHHFKKEDD